MSTLPTGDPENFIGELENMDLSELHENTFLVAVEGGKGIMPSTVSGPFNFLDMVDVVGDTFSKTGLNCVVFESKTDPFAKAQTLDTCTIDFIQANYENIIMDSFLNPDFSEEFTCKAGFEEIHDVVED